MRELAESPELGVEYYRAGPWIVSTPLYAGKEEEVEAAVVCPHWKYEEQKQEIIREESGQEIMVVSERCRKCVAARVRYRPAGQGQEIFSKPPPPAQGLCPTEKVFRFPTFVILTRRHQPGPDVPIHIMTRIEAGEKAYVVFQPLTGGVFSGAARDMVKEMRRVLKMGPEGYADYASFVQPGMSRSDKEEIVARAGELLPVAQAAGEEVLAQAEPALESQAEEEQKRISEAMEDPEKTKMMAELVRLERIQWNLTTALRQKRMSTKDRERAVEEIRRLDARIMELKDSIGM